MTTLSTTPPRQLTPAELEQRFAESYPELQGPGVETESGETRFGEPSAVRVGPIPKLLDDATRDRDNAARLAAWNALSPVERAALEDVRRMIREELRRA
jgi:hypothetical protein